MFSAIIILFSLLAWICICNLGLTFSALYFGFPIKKFYVGFRPIFKFWIKKTEIGLGWIPLGGFVLIEGLNGDSEVAKPTIDKLITILSGSFLCLACGVILYLPEMKASVITFLIASSLLIACFTIILVFINQCAKVTKKAPTRSTGLAHYYISILISLIFPVVSIIYIQYLFPFFEPFVQIYCGEFRASDISISFVPCLRSFCILLSLMNLMPFYYMIEQSFLPEIYKSLTNKIFPSKAAKITQNIFIAVFWLALAAFCFRLFTN